MPYLIQIAQASEWLLEHSSLAISIHDVKSRLLKLLAARNLATYTGQIRTISIIHAFQNHFPPGFLSALGCSIDDDQENWLLRLLRHSSKAFHPLYALLLLNFLEVSIDDFLDDLTFAPFGEPSWPCLNNTCQHYHLDVIDDCDISFSRDSCRPLGIFHCPFCEFTYSRLGPDKSEADRLCRSRILKFGPTWEGELTKFWLDESLSLRELSRLLGVDPRTVKKQALRLNLPEFRPGNLGGKVRPLKGGLVVPDPSPNQIQQMRKDWLNLRSQYPTACLSTLRQHQPGLFTWLYRHDFEWLQENKPMSIKSKTIPNTRVNWLKRDLDIANACLRVCLNIICEDEHIIRLTKTAIANRSGSTHNIFKNSNKLPNTQNMLQILSESRESFAIRRIWFQTEQFDEVLSEGERHIADWELVRLSGIARLQHIPMIAHALNRALDWLAGEIGSNEKDPLFSINGIRQLVLARH